MTEFKEMGNEPTTKQGEVNLSDGAAKLGLRPV